MVQLSAKSVYQVQPSLAPGRKLWHREKVKSADVPGKKNLVRADQGLLHKLTWRGGAKRQAKVTASAHLLREPGPGFLLYPQYSDMKIPEARVLSEWEVGPWAKYCCMPRKNKIC